MEIKVLGTGCQGCQTLHEAVKKAVEEAGITAKVLKEEDIIKIMSYNVIGLPALVIDGKVVSARKKLSVAELKKLLSDNNTER